MPDVVWPEASATATVTWDQVILVCIATFAGGLAFGVTGFAYGVVASLFLHHAYSPLEVVFILVTGGLWLNAAMLPRFWRDIDMREAAPFLAGATLGIPLGLYLLQQLSPGALRLATSLIVIGYCLFALTRHASRPLVFSPVVGRIVDTGIGFAGGVVGGVAGLGPLLPSVWYGLRGKSKTESRGLTQPFGLYVQSIMVSWFLLSSGPAPMPLGAVALGLPLMLLGAYMGVRVFERLSIDAFRLCIVWLSLAGAVILLARYVLA